MIYVMSDLHGCYDKYLCMLEQIHLGDSDTLYILGDVIDRGKDGVKILLDMMNKKNVIPIIGNHESMALSNLKKLHDGFMDKEWWQKSTYRMWMLSEGEPTALAFCKLSKEMQTKLIEYIESFLVYEEITVDGQHFHLSHTLPDFCPNLDIHSVSLKEFIWGETNYDACYGENTRFITGHTPTHTIAPEYKGRIWQGNGHIAIDCGAAYGGRLGCLCLDTMKEFYV